MSPEPSEMVARHTRVLAALAELGLTLAERAHARALAAETAEEEAGHALTFQRASRSARQSVALEARLERDERRRVQDQAAQAEQQARARVDRRRAQLKAGVARLIWNEYEADDNEALDLVDRLEERVDEESLYEAFHAEPVEAHIARLSAELGVGTEPQEDTTEETASDAQPGPARSAELADHDPQDPAADDYWRSSA